MTVLQTMMVATFATTIRGVMLERSTSMTILINSDTPITWDTEVNDWGDYWTSGSEVTVPSDAGGWHIITSNYVKDLAGTGFYSNGLITKGAGATDWSSGGVSFLYEGIVGTAVDEQHSHAAVASIQAGNTARSIVNSFGGAGTRTLEAGAKFGMAKITASPSRGVAVRKTGNTAITTGTDTTISNTTEDLDEGGYYDAGTSTSRLTVPTGEDGWYLISTFASWAATATGSTLRKTMIRKNGSGPWLAGRHVALTGGSVSATHSCPALAIAYLAATDYVELRVRHNHGSNLNLSGSVMTLAKAATATTIGARVSYAGSAQTVNSGSTAISFDTEERDDDGMVNLGSNATRITATEDGLYAIVGHVGFAANTGTQRAAILRVDGTTEIARDRSRADAAGTNNPMCNPGAVYYLTAGQYVELVAITGTNTSTATGDDRPALAMVLLGRD